MTIRRRSIVEFERWLARVIEETKTELYGITLEAEEVARKRCRAEVKLETLRAVQVQVGKTYRDPETSVESQTYIDTGELPEAELPLEETDK